MNKLYLKNSIKAIIFITLLISAKYNFGQSYNITNGVQAACTGTFYDSGGLAGNYGNNENYQYTICPTSPGQYIYITFTAFNTQSGSDVLIVYDGNGFGASAIATLSGTPAMPVTYKASSSNPTGCLTFLFYTNGSTVKPGWTANIVCSPVAGPIAPPLANLDCITKKKVCTTQTFSENNSGAGNIADLSAANEGCLASGEAGGILGGGGSSWYFFTAATSGTVGFDIMPSSSDDYDFGVWGPNPTCFPTTAPLRCSFFAPPSATYGYKTGMNAASVDLSENTSGDGYVKNINVIAGETYVIYVNRYAGSTNGFNMQFNGTATLDCSNVFGVVQPISLLKFLAKMDNTAVALHWETASENNNSRYTIEKSTDGINFNSVGNIAGAGNSNTVKKYDFRDINPAPNLSFYRLKQVDFNGDFKYSNMVPVYNRTDKAGFINVSPNPLPTGETKLALNYTAITQSTAIVSIKNTIGQELYRKEFLLNQGENALDISLDGINLNTNLYFVQVQTPAGVETQRLMIDKR